MPPDEGSDARLMVEGADDKNSIIHFMKRQGLDWGRIPGAPWVDDQHGVERLLDALPTASKTFRRLGIVCDADLVVSDRWRALRDRLAGASVHLPEAPDAQGTLVDLPGGRRIGVWLMPDNARPGALEDFLRWMVDERDAIWNYADEATKEARTRGAPLSERDFLKGRIHSWLAWQSEPGLPFGTAISAGFLKSNAPTTAAFESWFRSLFFS